MLLPLITEFLWTPKDLSILLQHPNHTFMSLLTLLVRDFFVTVPIISNKAKTAVKTLLHHWVTKYGPPIYLVTDRGSEYINKGNAHLCTLLGITHSLRTA